MKFTVKLRVRHPFGFHYPFEEVSSMNDNLPLELEAIIDGEPRSLGRYVASELKRSRRLIEFCVERTVRKFERIIEEDLAIIASGPLIAYTTPGGIMNYRDRLSHLLAQNVRQALKRSPSTIF